MNAINAQSVRQQWIRLLSWIWLSAGIGLGAYFILPRHDDGRPNPALSNSAINPSSTLVAFSGGESAPTATATRNIEVLRVGDRVLAHNPEISDEERSSWGDPNWEDWQRIALEMTKPDGGLLAIDMIRPKKWLSTNDVEEGGDIFLNLPEMGAQGHARVRKVSDCPDIRSGGGQVITATFAHPPSTELLNVFFEGETAPIGVTDNHLFWSVDREEFFAIGEMSIGERVSTYHGDTKRIVQKLARPGPETVYNLEVYAEHVYFVGEQGLLAHNTYPSMGKHGVPNDPAEFADWWKKTSAADLQKIWNTKGGQSAMARMIRKPGEFHEWLPTSRNLVFKEWGMSMADIWRLRTPNKALHPLSSAPTKGWYHTGVGRVKSPPGSQNAHNELIAMIDTVHAKFLAGKLKDPMGAFKRGLAVWSDKWMKNGVTDLPRGLGGTKPQIPLPTK